MDAPIEEGPPFTGSESLFGLALYGNVYLKLTSINIRALRKGKGSPETFFPLLVKKFGASRIAWGSNFPSAQGTLKEMVIEAKSALEVLPQQDQDWIFARTAQSLYPALADKNETAISGGIRALQSVYERNYDPHMKVSWKNFPNNQGHRFSPGCFRCHDGKHRSEDGTVLSRDCGLCHLLIERVGEEGAGRQDTAQFQIMKNPHPVDIGNSWKEMLCHECHGTSP